MNGPDLNSPADEILTKMIDLIHTAYERQHGPTKGYGDGPNSDREKAEKIEMVILSDPEGSSRRLADRAGCSRATLNRHRVRLREEGKIR